MSEGDDIAQAAHEGQIVAAFAREIALEGSVPVEGRAGVIIAWINRTWDVDSLPGGPEDASDEG